MKGSVRPAQRPATCRFCEKQIERGEMMYSFYSNSGARGGIHVHLHINCIKEITDQVLNFEHQNAKI